MDNIEDYNRYSIDMSPTVPDFPNESRPVPVMDTPDFTAKTEEKPLYLNPLVVGGAALLLIYLWKRK